MVSEMGYLKIYTLNLADPNQSFVLQNHVEIAERFNCITWGNSDPNIGQNGLIAGGMVDGSLMIWDGYTLLNPDLEQDALLCNIGLYDEQQFYSLEFNNFKKEWLATGGSDVYIANLENMGEEPDVFCPNTKENEFFITSVSWNKNRSLPHILASGSSDGSVNVWDLKVKRSISSFKDQSGSLNRNTQVSWNPDLPTQIAVTFDDQDEAGLQIWDLRNSKAPVTVFKESHVGSAVHCLSWSNTNSSHILTGDRNGAVVVWDYKNNEIVKEETLGYEFLTAQWIPNLPSMYYVIGNDGKMNLHTIDQAQVNKISQSHAPKWMKNPVCGTTLGNTVINYSKESGEVVKNERFTANGFTAVFDTWDQLMEGDDLDKLCDNQIENAQNSQEQDLWRLLKLADQDPTEMLSALDFDREEIVKKTEKFTGISHSNNNQNEGDDGHETKRKFEFAQMDEDEAAAFFNQLSSNVQNDNTENDEAKNVPMTMNCFFNEETDMETQTNSVNVNWDAGAEDLIRRNLFVGNFRGALDCALKCERHAHAFLIAYAKKDDPELMQLAADSFALLIKDPVSNLLQNVINDKVDDMIERYDLGRWKELASFIVANYEEDKNQLLSQLSKRLLKNKNGHAAQCLALISQDFELFEQLILEELEQVSGFERKLFIIETVKKLLVLKSKTGTVYSNTTIQSLLIELSYLLIEQTHFKLAYTILLELGDRYNNKSILSAMNMIYILYQPLLQLVFEAPTSIVESYQLPSIGRQIASNERSREETATSQTDGATRKGRWNRGKGRRPPAVYKTPKAAQPPHRRSNVTRSTTGYDESDDTYSLQSDLDLDTMNKQLPVGNRIKSNKFKKVGPAGNVKGRPQPAKRPRNIPQPVRKMAGPPKPARKVPAKPGPPSGPPGPRKPTVEAPQVPPPSRKTPNGPPRKTAPGPPKSKGPPAPRPAPGRAPPRKAPGPPAGRKPAPRGPPVPSQKSISRPGPKVPAPRSQVSQEAQSQASTRKVRAPPGRAPAPPGRTPAAPARRGPPGRAPAPPGRRGPPAPAPRAGPAKPTSQKSGPPSRRPGPPGRSNPAPPAKKAPAPPKKSAPPAPSRSQPGVHQHQSDTIDYESLFTSIEQAREFLEDIAEPNRVELYQSYLDNLTNQINTNQLQSDVMDNLSQFFDCLCESDVNGAKHYYKSMKRIANSSCREWLSVLDMILKNF